MSAKNTIENLLAKADIKINGHRAWDIQVHNERLYARVLSQGSLGLGEAYMDGWWDCQAIDQMIDRVIRADLYSQLKFNLPIIWNFIKAKLLNNQTISKSRQVGKQHYDVGNDLFKLMLDKRLNYSCGYWQDAKTLDEAQEAKLDLICRKVGLKPGMKVLDIGSGWGSFLKYAAEKYKISGVGVTISQAQANLSKELTKGLPIEILLQDYRKLNKKFDRIISIGMFEHVGYKNYDKFMNIVSKNLKDQGLLLLHTIGDNRSTHMGDPWLVKYIFPHGMLPSIKQIAAAAEGLFVMEDWHNFGVYYDPTLLAWHKNFNQNWHKLKDNYSERFKRMWNFYLLASAGFFRARKNQLWQIVFSKGGLPGGYQSIR